MNINWNDKGEDIPTYTDRIDKELSTKAKELDVSLAQIQELAVLAHTKLCKSNHTDMCSWYYSTMPTKLPWNDYYRGKFDPRIKWLQKAVQLLTDIKSFDAAKLALETVGKLLEMT